MIHRVRPELAIFALVDFDPDGIAIMRTYKYGSLSLRHEQRVSMPRLKWLGILSNDLMKGSWIGSNTASPRSQNQLNQFNYEPGSDGELNH